MALFDLPLEELREYLPARDEPPDFDDFWSQTLASTRAAAQPARFTPSHEQLRALEVFDVDFPGYAGQRIKAWLILPRHRRQPLPVVVEFVGYGGGRGLPTDWLTWTAAGYASLVMDTRGQGSLWVPGDTPDPDGGGPQVPGFLTRGIGSPQTYYYRRVFADAAMAVRTAREHPAIDAERIIIAGGSQGGAIAMAAGALDGSVAAALIDVPFLCHFRRAVEITDAQPYAELRQYLSIHRHSADAVFRTLAYFDGMSFAARGTAPALVSVGLMDDVCPPSTVFAAFNHYAGPKAMSIWPYNAHEAGTSYQVLEKIRFLADAGLAPEEITA